MIQDILILTKSLEKQINLLIHHLFIKKTIKVLGVVENITFKEKILFSSTLSTWIINIWLLHYKS